MSAAATSSPSQSLPVEPFGQTGVRQYAGRLLAWLCVTISLSAAAMTQRSSSFMDDLEWRGSRQEFHIISAGGQLALYGGGNANNRGDGNWRYRGGYLGAGAYRREGRMQRQPWQSEWGETIGFEVRGGPPTPQYESGFLLRLKWPTVAALFMIQPLVYVLRHGWRRRADARAAA